LKALGAAAGVTDSEVLDAAIAARAGNPEKWVEIVERACGS
jgi:hypothetical protein